MSDPNKGDRTGTAEHGGGIYSDGKGGSVNSQGEHVDSNGNTFEDTDKGGGEGESVGSRSTGK